MADENIYQVISRYSGKRVRLFNRRGLAGWLGAWGKAPQHYRIERAVIEDWEDCTKEFLGEQPTD